MNLKTIIYFVYLFFEFLTGKDKTILSVRSDTLQEGKIGFATVFCSAG